MAVVNAAWLNWKTMKVERYFTLMSPVSYLTLSRADACTMLADTALSMTVSSWIERIS
ncbi:MAG: 2-hydroxychromene-2-carboxylate isomerase, partial [Porticoccaceae bacterium]